MSLFCNSGSILRGAATKEIMRDMLERAELFNSVEIVFIQKFMKGNVSNRSSREMKWLDSLHDKYQMANGRF